MNERKCPECKNESYYRQVFIEKDGTVRRRYCTICGHTEHENH